MPFFEEVPKFDKSAKRPTLGDWHPSWITCLSPKKMIETLCQRRNQNSKCSLYHDIYQILFDNVKKAKEPTFCLRAVFQYLGAVNEIFPINAKWTLGLFEIWLNGQVDIDLDLQLSIRAKIVGRHLPRAAHQVFFPIGDGQTLLGSHVVTAHISPDLDTCIASFWGWSDAFAARLSSQIHSWNLPGGNLAPQDRLIVDQLMGPELLQQLPTSQTALCLQAIDLIDQRALITLSGDQQIELRADLNQPTIAVMVDTKGSYLGDLNSWDQIDLTLILTPIALALQWLIAQAQAHISHEKLVESTCNLAALRELPLKKIPPVAGLPESTLALLDQIIQSYFGLSAGLKTKLAEISQGLITFAGLRPFAFLADLLSDLLEKDGSFCKNGDSFIQQFESAAQNAQNSLYRLDVLIEMKTEILKRPSFALHSDDELNAVRAELKKSPARVVVLQESKDNLTPLGAVFASKLSMSFFGTATLRDFCNRQEICMPPYLEIVSVLDHHKTDLQTHAVATCSSADVQSCNVLTAELALNLNDRCCRATKKSEKAQLASLLADRATRGERAKLRLLQRSISRCLAHESGWYIHKEREMVEYLSLLHAIFDDTDLLMKATPRDVRCVAQLLNRAKSLQCQHEVEIIDEEGLEENEHFSRLLASRILQHEESYSLYSQVFAYRSKIIEKSLWAAADRINYGWFADTKEQNGCARVGQSKLFARNVKTFHDLCSKLQSRFIDLANDLSQGGHLLLHLHMCSTIVDADEVYKGQAGRNYPHCDQLWFWLPDDRAADAVLKSFLVSFSRAKELMGQTPRLEIFNDQNERLKKLFDLEKAPWTVKQASCDLIDQPFAVLYVLATSLNSRKAAIAPHLPAVKAGISTFD